MKECFFDQETLPGGSQLIKIQGLLVIITNNAYFEEKDLFVTIHLNKLIKDNFLEERRPYLAKQANIFNSFCFFTLCF